LKFKVKVSITDAEMLFDILPATKLLTYNLPVNGGGQTDAAFTSAIEPEELKKLLHRMANGSAIIESLKINYD
jgi:hypothetical protein